MRHSANRAERDAQLPKARSCASFLVSPSPALLAPLLSAWQVQVQYAAAAPDGNDSAKSAKIAVEIDATATARLISIP